MDTLSRFRRSVETSNRGRRRMGWRYSGEEKALAVAYCHQRQEEGWSLASIAEELGVSPLTLSRWLTGSAARTGGFREISVVEPELVVSPEEIGEVSPGLCVVTPGGLRIEGLEWPQVLELARAYS